MLKPVGLTQKQFRFLAVVVRNYAGDLGNEDIRVHGSRALRGKARPDSDLDIAIRVTPEKFDRLMIKSFGTPNPCSSKERTMLKCKETGKIQAGEVGLRLLRRTLATDLKIDVDLSVIKMGGEFDRGPWIEVPKVVKE